MNKALSKDSVVVECIRNEKIEKLDRRYEWPDISVRAAIKNLSQREMRAFSKCTKEVKYSIFSA